MGQSQITTAMYNSAMARKHEKRTDPAPESAAFSQLREIIMNAGIRFKPEEKPVPRTRAAAPPERNEKAPPEDPQLAFEQAMQGVSRTHWRRDPAPASHVPPPAVTVDREAEEEKLFREAMSSDAAPPIMDHPEYIEGWIGLAGQRFISGLRNGVYSIQGALDLHGLSRIEARAAVEEFIVRMSRERSCCVKIVHGRGINSPDDRAILKENLQHWLATRRMSRHVVAYASAPHTDGGVGAVYVLLRRKH